MSRTTASLCVIVVTLITSVALFFAPFPETHLLHTTPVIPGELEKTCMLQGTVTFEDKRYLLAPADGLVEQLFVAPGDAVCKDQLLLSLSAQAEISALAALESQAAAVKKQTADPTTALFHKTAEAYDLLQYETNYAKLTALIAAKQIRAVSAGVLENLFVKSGDFVASGMPLAEVRGDDLCITAVWTGEHNITPKAGMKAWWCNPTGERMGELLLTSVSLAESGDCLRLSFSPSNETSLPYRAGDTMPVLLLLDKLPETGLVPVNAVGRNNRIWVIRNGSAIAESLPLGQGNGKLIQVPQALCGLQVILDPEGLEERLRIRTGEEP